MTTQLLHVEQFVSADQILDAGDRHMASLYRSLRRRLLFTQPGLMRLASVTGWLRGLRDSGDARATAMASNFARQLSSLVWHGEADVSVNDFWTAAPATVQVPRNKVILADDGCHHSFGFAVYQPLQGEELDAYYAERRDQLDKGLSWSAATQAAAEAMNVQEEAIPGDYCSRLTEERYVPNPGRRVEVPYRFRWNGGLIFHGSRLNDVDGTWSCHT